MHNCTLKKLHCTKKTHIKLFSRKYNKPQIKHISLQIYNINWSQCDLMIFSSSLRFILNCWAQKTVEHAAICIKKDFSRLIVGTLAHPEQNNWKSLFNQTKSRSWFALCDYLKWESEVVRKLCKRRLSEVRRDWDKKTYGHFIFSQKREHCPENTQTSLS